MHFYKEENVFLGFEVYSCQSGFGWDCGRLGRTKDRRSTVRQWEISTERDLCFLTGCVVCFWRNKKGWALPILFAI